MIQLYRNGSAVFKLDSRNLESLRMVSDAKLERKAMEEDKVSVSLLSIISCTFEYRDYIIVDGRPYFLNLLPKAVKEDKRRFIYDMDFEGGMYELGRVAYTMAGLRGWDFTGQLYDFCGLVVNELNRNSLVIKDSKNHVLRYSGRMVSGEYYWQNIDTSDTESYFTVALIPSIGDTVYTGEIIPGVEMPTVAQVGGAWTLDFELDDYPSGKPIVTEEKMLTYDNHTCLAVMNDLVAQWEGWEYAVDVRSNDLCNIDSSVPTQCGGKLVVRRKITVSADTTKGIWLAGNTNHTNMAFGKKGGISNITREYSDDSNMPSRIYFYGGRQNVPTNYRNTRICLPSATKELSYKDTGLSDNKHCEAVKLFDDIFPACRPFAVSTAGTVHDEQFCFNVLKSGFFDLKAVWQDPMAETPAEYGSYNEWLLSYGTGNATTDLQRYLLYYYEGDTSQGARTDFPKNCYLMGDVTITFQTGDLAGMSFKVHDFGVDGNQYVITCNKIGIENPFEDTNYVPNGDMMCKAGDKFIVEGCLMPASYVYDNFGSGDYAAETLLDDESGKYIDELASKVKVGVEISKDYINTHNAVFRLYDRIQLGDTDLLPTTLYYRVNRLTYDLLQNTYKVEIDDGKNINPWKALVQYLNQISEK